MNITSAKYAENGTIIAVIDGREMTVPANDKNRHYRAVIDSGIEIQPYSPPAPTSDDVNAERKRRIEGGVRVIVQGVGPVKLQGRQQDMSNLQGLAFAAQMRIASGDTSYVEVFRDMDNNDHDMTPQQVVSMWAKGSAWVKQVYKASWALKDMDPIPADYKDDAHWP